MKKLLLIIIFVMTTLSGFSCHESYTTLVSGPTAIGGGQYSTTVQFCIGQTVNWGGTFDFTVTLNGANIVSYAPANLSNTYNAYTGASCGGPNCFMNSCAAVTANATSSLAGNVVTYTTSSSTPAGYPLVPDDVETCGANSTSYCFNFTFVSDAYPTSIVLGGNIELTRVVICQSVCGHPATYTSPCNGTYDPAMTLIFTPLPIELEWFTGHNEGNINKLSWVTATEINNDYFTIERSRDTKNWVTLGNVSGAGNSNTPIMYEFDDDDYEDGVNYYRLTQTDFNGAFESFKIITINTDVIPWQDYTIINLLGQEVHSDYDGIRIIIFEDGRRMVIPSGVRTPKITR